MHYPTFTDFLAEADQSDELQENPVYKLKQKFSDLINELLEWIPQNKTAKIEEIKNKILLFRSSVDQLDNELSKNIENYKVKISYKEGLERLMSMLDEFEDPSAEEISKMMDDLVGLLSSFHTFVQSKIAI